MAQSQAAQYRLAVTNSMPHPMDVFFRDTSDHALGTLDAGQQKAVAIVAARPTIQVTWRAGTMGHAGGWMVTLRPDSLAEVTC